VRIPGFFVAFIAGAACLYALVAQDPAVKPIFPALQSVWFFWHVAIAFGSYAIFVVAFAVELSYLIQIFLWKVGSKKDYGLTRENIARFHRSVHQLVLFGFPMLTFGIMSGAAWANEAWGVYWQWDPKETWSLITWFAFALYLINRYHQREVHREIRHFLPRHALLLFLTGIVGGVISSITGSGLDITTFSLLVLRLRINEKIATPTSVVLMGLNAAVGFAWKELAGSGMAPEAWGYWWVCVPIVVVGAPFGAWFIKHRSRLFVAGLLYASIAAQFVAALLIVPMTPALVAFSAAVFLAGLTFFRWMANRGVRRLEWLAAQGLAGRSR